MLAPGTSVGRYLVHRKLAEGGMAEIYLASAVGPEGFSKEVVIKVVRGYLASDPQFVQLFIAEARLASRLNHANVVQIFDFGKHDDTYYLAMEFIRGASLWDLRKRCREFGVPFPPLLAAQIGAQVARGLHYAHSLSEGGQKLGVVHRDVTPHNVLLSFDGAVKLTDFGIAKATSSHTAPGMLKGKFAYMSPEQARGERVDARTDTFALGIVLWELLTGGRLFDGESDVAVLRSVLETVVAPPIRLNPDVHADLSEIVMKALTRKLEERFQTAAELERALANFVLRHSHSMDDAAVGPFLQQMFREEFEPRPLDAAGTADDGDDYGVGHTRFIDRGQRKIEPTMTGTPVRPLPANATPKPLPAAGVLDAESLPAPTEDMHALPPQADQPAPRAPSGKLRAPSGVVPKADAPPQRTEDMRAVSSSKKLPKTEPVGDAVPRAGTEPVGAAVPEQAPASRGPPSRRFDPLPLDSSMVEGSVTTAPAPTEPVTAKSPTLPSRSKAPALVLTLVGVAAVAALAYSQRAAPPAPAPVADVAPPVAEPTPEPVTPLAEPVDAGVAEVPPVVAAAPVEPKAPKPAAKVERPVVRQVTGSLKVKARPFGLVSIDNGRDLEVTGQRTVQLPLGAHDVTIRSNDSNRKHYTVRIKANETEEIEFEAVKAAP